MKIPASIRKLYEDQKTLGDELKRRVDDFIKPRLHDRWHYESRIKTDESFTLKIESGRFANPAALEDFFAATVVVRNAAEIAKAEAIVTEAFTVHSRRPERDGQTHKAADAFPFDDLRMYVSWRDDAALPPSGLHGIVFELQIKTFLQHAWSIATHDLIYKSDDANWSKMRIAYQIKAMLEHAELSIQEATRLSESASLAKSDDRTATIKTFIDLVTELWGREHLPGNVRGLAENVMGLAKLAGFNAHDLRAVLLAEQAEGRGPLTQNLTPYGTVLQTLFITRREVLCTALTKRQRHPVLISSELELPEGVDTATWEQAAVFIR